MPDLLIDQMGMVGLNTDRSPSDLPPNAWTYCRNVIARDGKAVKTWGSKRIISLQLEPVYRFTYTNPQGTQYLVNSDGRRFVIYALDGTWKEITPSLSQYPPGEVTFCSLNGVLIANSTSTGPFYWPGNFAGGDLLLPLPGWNTDNWRCKGIVAYKYYLVAYGMIEDWSTSASYYPHKIRWSTAAQEGAVPTEWLPTASNQAGDDILGETTGELLGAVNIKDSLWLLKRDAIYSLDWIGGQYVMQSKRLQGVLDIASVRAGAEFRGTLLLLSGKEVGVYDGVNYTSIIDNKVRNACSVLFSAKGWDKGELFVDKFIDNLFVMGKPQGQHQFLEALVYDLTTQTWGQMDLNYAFGMDSILYAKDTSSPILPEIIVYESAVSNQGWWVSLLDRSGTTADGVPISSTLERRGITPANYVGMAMGVELWVEAIDTADMQVFFGVSDYPQRQVMWEGPHTLQSKTSPKVDIRSTGRYFHYGFIFPSALQFEMLNATIRWEAAGGQ